MDDQEREALLSAAERVFLGALAVAALLHVLAWAIGGWRWAMGENGAW